jgi:hypothetical protein
VLFVHLRGTETLLVDFEAKLFSAQESLTNDTALS